MAERGKTVNSGYNFINHHPGTHKLRDGSVVKGDRGPELWKKALAGHVWAAHNGVWQKDCAACVEIRSKIGAM